MVVASPPLAGGAAVDWTYPEKVESKYYSWFELPNNRRAYTLAGVAVCTVKNDRGEAGRFYRKQLYVILDIPDLGNKRLKLDHWAPFFALNAISNDGPANNAAWAVDRWTVAQPGGVPINEPTQVVGYTVDLAVGDSDGYILRVGYNVNLLGEIV
jgi:hypothetical protein